MSFSLKTWVFIYIMWFVDYTSVQNLKNCKFDLCGKAIHYLIGQIQWGFTTTSNLQPVVCLRSLDVNKQNHAGLVQNGELIWWLLTSHMIIKWNHTPTCRVADLIWPCWLHLTSKDISVQHTAWAVHVFTKSCKWVCLHTTVPSISRNLMTCLSNIYV